MRRYFRQFQTVVLVLGILLLSANSQPKQLPQSLQELIETEKAFARLSVAKGVRESFIAYFADDGINFQPGPVNTKESYRSRPAPVTPQPYTLNWSPVWGNVSAAGDLGFNTGPYSLTNQTNSDSIQHGMFFSVWQRQADQSWKVLLDIGIRTPAAVAALAQPYMLIGNFPESASEKKDQNNSLDAIEKQLAQELARGDGQAAFAQYFRPDTRLLRQGLMPFVGIQAVKSWLGTRKVTLEFKLLKSAVAKSRDLGWVMGQYKIKGNAGEIQEHGHFVRVWQKDRKLRWKILLDVTNAMPNSQ